MNFRIVEILISNSRSMINTVRYLLMDLQKEKTFCYDKVIKSLISSLKIERNYIFRYLSTVENLFEIVFEFNDNFVS